MRTAPCGLWGVVLCVLIGACAPPATGHGPAEPPPPISLAGQVELGRLLDLAAERRGLRVEYDAAALKATVTLRLPGEISDDELWSLVNQLLAARGLTTVRTAGSQTFSVVKLADASAVARIDEAVQANAGFQTVLIRLTHKTPKEAAEAVKLVLGKSGAGVAELPGTSLLLVSDLGPRIEQVETILRLVDVPGPAVSLTEIRVEAMPAPALVAMVQQLAQKREAVDGRKFLGQIIPSATSDAVYLVAPEHELTFWKGLITQVDRRDAVETRVYSPRRFAVREVSKLVEQIAMAEGNGPSRDDRWRMIPDELTGTLIITASGGQHERIRALMERLDAANAAESRPMRAFPIRNRSVVEVRNTLAQLVDAGALDASASASDARESITQAALQRTVRETTNPLAGSLSPPTAAVTNPVPTSPPSPAQPLGKSPPMGGARSVAGGGLSLTADEATNTLIAVGEPRVLAQLENLLQLLDVRQPQVMLEVMLISVNDSDSLNLGVELEKLGNVGDAAYKLLSLFGISSVVSGVRVPTEGQGFTGAVLNPGDFNIIVRALETINKGRSLSSPRLLVSNNEQANFSSVLQQPVLTTSVSNTSTIESYGGTEDAGTTIAVKPQIAQGDHLVLTYSINLSSFVGTSAGAGLPPPKQQNGVDSVATIPDGHVVVVGGLELSSDSKGTSQIPGLGDIPLVGEAFKSRTRNVNRTRFYVFIKATILRQNGFEDLKYISSQDASVMGVSDGFPVVKPRVIR